MKKRPNKVGRNTPSAEHEDEHANSKERHRCDTIIPLSFDETLELIDDVFYSSEASF